MIRLYPSKVRLGAAGLLTACLASFVALECHAKKSEPKQQSLNADTSAHAVAPDTAERSSMFTRRPLVNLRVDIEQCSYQLFLNGGLVTSNLEGNAHEEQPVNHWLHTGSNELQVYMYKSNDEPDACDVKVAVTVKDNDNDQIPQGTALVLAHSAKGAKAGSPTKGSSPPGLFDSHQGFRASDKGDVRVGPAKIVHLTGKGSLIYVLGRTFEVQLPFPDWAFFRGEKMKQWWEFESEKAMDPAYDEILGAYRKVWSFLQKRDVNGFLDACEERSREVDLAYYKQPGETRTGLRKDLENAMNDPKFELATVENRPGKFWRYTVGSTGKVIALTQGDRGSPIFRFQMKDGTPFSLIFPVVFRKEGNRYIVTR